MKDRLTIGRAPESDLVIDERWDTVSNDHAVIVQTADGLVFYDHSSNGTIINNQKIHNTNVGIYPGDKIMLAGVFELTWDAIETYFPRNRRPTVTKNVRTEPLIDEPRPHYEPTPEERLGGVKSRKTEKFTPGVSYHEPEPMPSKPKPKPTAKQDVNVGVENQYSQAEIDKFLEKWNWGAFFCPGFWGLYHKKVWPFLACFLSGIPFIGIFIGIGVMVYLGMKGSKMAWNTGMFSSFEKYRKTQKWWAIGGFCYFVISIIVSYFYMSEILSTI